MKRNKYNAKPYLQMLFFLTTMKLTDFLKRIIYLRFKERLGVALSETVVEQVFFLKQCKLQYLNTLKSRKIITNS